MVCKFSAGSGGQIGWRTWFASTIGTRASSLRTAAFFSSSHHHPLVRRALLSRGAMLLHPSNLSLSALDTQVYVMPLIHSSMAAP